MLKFNHAAGAFHPGIPARDLTDEEVELYGGEELLLSLAHGGQYLYMRAESPRSRKSDAAPLAPREDGE